MLFDLKGNKIILASKSPRRHELLKGLGFDFEVRTKDVDESFSDSLKGADIPLYLSKKKADAFVDELKPNEILITSDTVVWLGNKVFNKPESAEEAVEMIATLSGRMHEVITAVCLTSLNTEKDGTSKQVVFHDLTSVHFAKIERADIEWYVNKYKPFDKAGAYGIQEWIGYAGIDKIEGSFYNVMGLPTQKLYVELKKFLNV
ncbi:septum formation protein Maf [Cryomorpha ignava]|uniref:dTTP/UTP pyrophosphatase n=1 Tax=Cryomorpha ignava TaxID=101383 RepID=A0A7K3WSW4_9FLAO|nr:septum formation protein Maf [Cryomorpha ignava]